MLNKQHHASGVRPATQARGHKDTNNFIHVKIFVITLFAILSFFL